MLARARIARVSWWQRLLAWLPRRAPIVRCSRCGCVRDDVGQRIPRGTRRVCNGQFDFDWMDGKRTKTRHCSTFEVYSA